MTGRPGARAGYTRLTGADREAVAAAAAAQYRAGLSIADVVAWLADAELLPSDGSARHRHGVRVAPSTARRLIVEGGATIAAPSVNRGARRQRMAQVWQQESGGDQ